MELVKKETGEEKKEKKDKAFYSHFLIPQRDCLLFFFPFSQVNKNVAKY